MTDHQGKRRRERGKWLSVKGSRTFIYTGGESNRLKMAKGKTKKGYACERVWQRAGS